MTRTSELRLERSAYDPSPEERNWAALCHLAAALGFLFLFGNVLGPFLIWAWKRRESPYIAYHGCEAVNFQISICLYLFVTVLLAIALALSGGPVFVSIGVALYASVMLIACAGAVVAALRANRVQPYRYPFTIRFLS